MFRDGFQRMTQIFLGFMTVEDGIQQSYIVLRHDLVRVIVSILLGSQVITYYTVYTESVVFLLWKKQVHK